jgi:hypothetical protein
MNKSNDNTNLTSHQKDSVKKTYAISVGSLVYHIE